MGIKFFFAVNYILLLFSNLILNILLVSEEQRKHHVYSVDLSTDQKMSLDRIL